MLPATLKARMDSLLSEGKDENSVYSWLQEGQSTEGAEILPCNGRTTLLAVYANRDRLVGKTVAFLADRDMWLFTGVPAAYAEIVFTEGYSIENDVLLSGTVHRFFSPREKAQFRKLTHALAMWLAREVAEHLRGHPAILDVHVDRLIPLGGHTLDTNYAADRAYRSAPSPELVRCIRARPKQLVRGKQILQLYARLLSDPRRQARYSKHAVLEIAVKGRRSRELQRIRQEVARRLGK
jgi:hypothetical protein